MKTSRTFIEKSMRLMAVGLVPRSPSDVGGHSQSGRLQVNEVESLK